MFTAGIFPGGRYVYSHSAYSYFYGIADCHHGFSPFPRVAYFGLWYSFVLG